MNGKTKKILIIAGIVVDIAITVFLFVISIIMLAMLGKYGSPKEAINHAQGLILFLLQNTSIYFWVFVFPLFILLAGNIIGLVIYVKKTASKDSAPAKLDDLTEEQKEALRLELLKDLQAKTESKPEAEKAEENKE